MSLRIPGTHMQQKLKTGPPGPDPGTGWFRSAYRRPRSAGPLPRYARPRRSPEPGRGGDQRLPDPSGQHGRAHGSALGHDHKGLDHAGDCVGQAQQGGDQSQPAQPFFQFTDLSGPNQGQVFFPVLRANQPRNGAWPVHLPGDGQLRQPAR